MNTLIAGLSAQASPTHNRTQSSTITGTVEGILHRFNRLSRILMICGLSCLPFASSSFAATLPKSPSKTEAVEQTQVSEDDHTQRSAAGVAPKSVVAAPETSQISSADAERHQLWLDGVNDAAARNGCKSNVIVQRDDETTADVIRLFSMTATEGTCLALAPVSVGPGPVWYSFASGGTIDGVTIYYLSDVSRIRIWNGTPVTGN